MIKFTISCQHKLLGYLVIYHQTRARSLEFDFVSTWPSIWNVKNYKCLNLLLKLFGQSIIYYNLFVYDF